jgi:hypothetical protein
MTTEPMSSSTQKEYYDADYFDSDEDIDIDESAMGIDKSEDTGWSCRLLICSFQIPTLTYV